MPSLKNILYLFDLNKTVENDLANIRIGISSDLEGRFFRSKIAYYKMLEKIIAFNETPKEVIYKKLVALFREYAGTADVTETVPRKKDNPTGERMFTQIKPDIAESFKNELRRRLWSVTFADQATAVFMEKLLMRLRYELDPRETVNFAEGLSLPHDQEMWILDLVKKSPGLFNITSFHSFLDLFKLNQKQMQGLNLKQMQTEVIKMVSKATENVSEYIFTDICTEMEMPAEKSSDFVRTRYSLTEFFFKFDGDDTRKAAVNKWISSIDKVVNFPKYLEKAAVPKELSGEKSDYGTFSAFMKMASRADLNRRKYYYMVLRSFMDVVNKKYFDLKLEYVSGNKNYYIPVETANEFVKRFEEKPLWGSLVEETKNVPLVKKSVIVTAPVLSSNKAEVLLDLLQAGKISESTALKFLEKVN